MWWNEIKDLDSYTVEELLSIIDDALCYGFEFKVENHKVFWRETV